MPPPARRLTGKQAPKVIKRRLKAKQPPPLSYASPTGLRVVFTGPFEFTAYKGGRPNIKETEQLTTRVRYIHFNKPAAAEHIGRALEQCPFVLESLGVARRGCVADARGH